MGVGVGCDIHWYPQPFIFYESNNILVAKKNTPPYLWTNLAPEESEDIIWVSESEILVPWYPHTLLPTNLFGL